MMALNDEYKLRYNKKVDHVSIQKLGELLKQFIKGVQFKSNCYRRLFTFLL